MRIMKQTGMALATVTLGFSMVTTAVAQDNYCSANPPTPGMGIVPHQFSIYHWDPKIFVQMDGVWTWALKVRPRNGYCLKTSEHWTKTPYGMADIGIGDGPEFHHRMYPGGGKDCDDGYKSIKYVFLPPAQAVYDVYTNNNGRMTTVAASVKYAYGSNISPTLNGKIDVKVYLKPQMQANGTPSPTAIEVAGICRLGD